MNILPKKNWHVRSKTNIARVHADEAKAAEEEAKEQERIRIAEQEARTNLLRSRARERSGLTDQKSVSILFGGEAGKDESATNKDHEREKKEEIEKKEKAIGLLTYLGQSATDPQHAKPWWSEAPSRESRKRSLDKDSNELLNEWDTKKKKRLDPMVDISRITDFLHERDSKREAESSRPISQKLLRTLDDKALRLPNDILRPPTRHKTEGLSMAPSSLKSSDSKERKRKKSKKEKKKKKKKHKKERHRSDASSDSSEIMNSKASTSNIEELRNQRLQRERAERNREIAILQRHQLEKSGVAIEHEEVTTDERSLPYNSVFNPDLSRRPGKRRKTNEQIVSELLK